jgi:hypothetical protein
MRVPFRASWRLRAIERGLRRSEPHLAAMLAIFAHLYAGEVIISREQAHRPGNWAGLALAVPTGAVSGLLAGARWVSDRATRLYVQARQRLSRIVRALLVTPADAVGFTQPTRSPGQ